MEAIVDSVLDLIGQLLLIGSTEPVVMIAGVAILSCIVLAVASIVCAAIISIPLGIGHFIIKLIVVIARRVSKRDVEEYDGEYEDGDCEECDEEDDDSFGDEVTHADNHVEPRYPDWMKQKSGRLL